MSEVKNLNELFENTKEAYLKEKKAPDEELQAAIEAGFDALADYLMNECVLDVNGNEYRIAEIEFYYFDKNNHPDVFAHCHQKQKEHNKFYFHGSGIDLTFGNKNYYGGILIRGLIRKQKNTFVLGPHKVSTEFLHNANEIDNKLELTITLKVKQQPKNNIVKSCRVGLNINNSNNCIKIDSEEIEKLKKGYIFKPYRYIIKEDNLLYELLKNSSNEPTFLAWFLDNKKYNDFDIFNKDLKNKIMELLKNIDIHKKEKFKKDNQKKEKERIEFIDVFIPKHS